MWSCWHREAAAAWHCLVRFPQPTFRNLTWHCLASQPPGSGDHTLPYSIGFTLFGARVSNMLSVICSRVPEQPSQCSAHCFSVCSKARAAEWKRARANWPEFDPPRSIPPIIRPTHQSGPIMNWAEMNSMGMKTQWITVKIEGMRLLVSTYQGICWLIRSCSTPL